MKQSLILLVACLAVVYCDSRYVIGAQGASCNEVCFGLGMNCNPNIVTNNSTDAFAQLGISCQPDQSIWSHEDHPSYVSAKTDPDYGKCSGYLGVPAATQCSGTNPSAQRLCLCDSPVKATTFGTGYSNGDITTEEKWHYVHTLADGEVGVMTHFWTTYGTPVDNGVIIRYYIDGEKNASIEFTPSLACGVGFYDAQGPWGTEWFGKGAKNAGWYNNFRIPFQKSIVITAQHLFTNYTGFFLIVRGSTNVPITVGGQTLPKNAKMNQFRINKSFKPLEFVPLVDIPSGPGVHWMITLSTGSGNLYFLEGCFHAYFDGNDQFPGVVLSTGTEDYFDSAWYFDGGQFHLPVSGFTHLNQTANYVTFSAYRFHDKDPLFFNDGFQLYWRVGDAIDAALTKCNVQLGGTMIGTPTITEVIAYAWTYTWN